MSMILDTRKSNFWESIMVAVPYFVHTLIQNVTDVITKRDDYFITKFTTKYVRFFVQNATTLLQNPTVVTKCVSTFTLNK